ncbi:hypothetical protein CEXT_789561 [Caerostris extrusa]|uniref:Uncharacterized protein n=1 Tax=Caerostris extrusa TaxID=172846 RepID=A0AAV4R277_CAEEX|nr:hypothetical protein CEXT_789561 [Caerostris extrusa]
MRSHLGKTLYSTVPRCQSLYSSFFFSIRMVMDSSGQRTSSIVKAISRVRHLVVQYLSGTPGTTSSGGTSGTDGTGSTGTLGSTSSGGTDSSGTQGTTPSGGTTGSTKGTFTVRHTTLPEEIREDITEIFELFEEMQLGATPSNADASNE